MMKTRCNPLMAALTGAAKCVVLSLCWILTCIPVVTIGASSAALYDAVYYGFLQGEKQVCRRFFRSFRNNMKPGILPGIVFLGIFGAGSWILIRLWNGADWGQVSLPMFLAAGFVVLLLLGMLSVMFPMLSRFNNTFGGLLRNTVLLPLANLPKTLGLGLVNGVSILLCAKFIFPLLFLPALTSLLSTRFLEPMFKPYMGDEPQ